MKKEEMIATMNKRFEAMNEEGVKILFEIITSIPDKERWMASTTPERIAELDALKEQKEQEEKKAKEQENEEANQRFKDRRNQVYHDFSRMFDAIYTVDIPSRYYIGTDEIQAIDCICGEVGKIFPNYMLNASKLFFSYGFVKGTRYAKAQAKKTIKKKAANCN